MPSSRSKKKKVSKRKTPARAGRKSARRPIHVLPARTRAAGKSVGELFADFVAVQARLRAPGGCPWDREQTHLTLRTYLIEEAYEVLDAIESGKSEHLAEELGDLLLQVLFHADLAREAGAFDISHVITGIQDKMIRRHPHVFGNVKAETSGEVLKNWAQLKAKEKQKASENSGAIKGKDVARPPSALEGVPRHLPALLEADQLTRKAAHVGFDWENVEGIFEKLQEEIAELQSALPTSDRRAIEEEIGDLFFSLVNLARFLKLDPEVALKQANLKFKNRFEQMEAQANSAGIPLAELSKEELENLWASAKAKLRIAARPDRRT